jgi:hypothetical protein
MFARITVCLLLSVSLAAFAAESSQPDIQFGPDGITVGGIKPGEQVAWMALVRRSENRRIRVRVLRGLARATGQAPVRLPIPQSDEPTLLTVAVLERGHGANRSRSDRTTSPRAIEATAVAGDTTLSVQSSFVELMYVRPGRGVWSFRAGDGGGLDQDGVRDGWVTIALASLVFYKGNPHPPSTIEAGDRVFLIDPTELRAGDVEVGR